MIPVMVVPILVRPEMLYRMLRSIDAPVEHLVIIDNGGVVEDLPPLPHIGRVSVIRMPSNLGVAGSWNLGIKATPFAPWWLFCNFDVKWPPGSLATLASDARPDALTIITGPQPFCAFVLGDEVVETVGLFDETIHPAYFEDDDYRRRVQHHGLAVLESSAQVYHDNSSTLSAGYEARNNETFQANMGYMAQKVARNDVSAGTWSLKVRRVNSWD